MLKGLDFADVKPSILSWLTVTIMAVTGIVFLKFITARYNIPAISSVIAAV